MGPCPGVRDRSSKDGGCRPHLRVNASALIRRWGRRPNRLLTGNVTDDHTRRLQFLCTLPGASDGCYENNRLIISGGDTRGNLLSRTIPYDDLERRTGQSRQPGLLCSLTTFWGYRVIAGLHPPPHTNACDARDGAPEITRTKKRRKETIANACSREPRALSNACRSVLLALVRV